MPSERNYQEIIEKLLAENEANKKRLERVEAVNEINRCMAHYEEVHLNPEYIARSIESFAMWRPDVSCEVSDWGCVFGPDAMRKFWESQTGENLKGGIFFHTVCTPAIEVAANGKTAKGVFASAGFETMPAGIMNPDPKSFWCWGKYGMDFIKNLGTGEWKIWHMKWFRTIRSDFYVDWYTDSKNTLKGQPSGAFEHPDVRPSVFHRPYNADEIPHPFPCVPDPYENYDGSFRWLFGGEESEKRFGVSYPEDYRSLYNANYPEPV